MVQALVGTVMVLGILAACGRTDGPAVRPVRASTPPSVVPTLHDPQAHELPRVLVFSKTAGFRHESIPDGIRCVREIGTNRFNVDATEDAGAFTSENLARYGAVVWLSTTGDVLNDEQQRAFERFIRRGGAYVGIHAASDTEYEWPWYGRLVGAYFRTHPPVQEAVNIVEDRKHPSTEILPERWTRRDEWYGFQSNPRSIDGVRVLMSLDETTYEPGESAMGKDHPIAWYHAFEGGRAWYTGGGHTSESFNEPLFRAHLLGGILWGLRVEAEVPAARDPAPRQSTPTP